MTTFTQSGRTEKAIEVLQLTNDGDDLGPQDLSLLQSAVNGHLTETGLSAFDQLHECCRTGSYQRPFLFGLEPLTQDLDGMSTTNSSESSITGSPTIPNSQNDCAKTRSSSSEPAANSKK